MTRKNVQPGGRPRSRGKRRITLQVTLAGWVFLLMWLLVGVAAFRGQTMPMMFFLFGAMLGCMLVSLFIAHRMLAATGVHRELPARAWQFETLYFGYFLRNTRRHSPCLGLSLKEIVPRGVEDASGYCVYLPARSVFRAGSRLAAARRGRIDLQGLRLSTRFPFGLVVFQRDVDQPASLVVWPAKGKLKADLLRRGAMESSSSPPGRLQGGQDEFFGLRDYRIGDNPRWIHWRRSAGRDTLVVREMAKAVPEILFIVLDVRLSDGESPGLDERERLLRFAATLIDHAMRRGYQVGLAMGEGDGIQLFAPATGVGPRCDMLDAMASVRDSVSIPLGDVILQIPPAMPANAQTLVIAPRRDRIDPIRMSQLSRASRHLAVLCGEELENVFEDNPLVGREAPQ